MRHRHAFLVLAALAALAHAAPTVAQVQKDDHAWQPPVYNLQSTTDSTVATVNPLTVVPCTGCGGPPPTVTPPPPQQTAARWAYNAWFPAALAGGVTDIAMLRSCLKRSDNSAADPSLCTDPAPREICIIDSMGWGCCPQGVETFGTAMVQTQFANTRTYGNMYWRCN